MYLPSTNFKRTLPTTDRHEKNINVRTEKAFAWEKVAPKMRTNALNYCKKRLKLAPVPKHKCQYVDTIGAFSISDHKQICFL